MQRSKGAKLRSGSYERFFFSLSFFTYLVPIFLFAGSLKQTDPNTQKAKKNADFNWRTKQNKNKQTNKKIKKQQ